MPVLDKGSEEADIKKNYKNVCRIFEEEDSQFLSAIEQQNRQLRKQVRERFMNVVNRRRDTWKIRQEERDSLYKEQEPVFIEHEFTLEEIIHTSEEIILSE
jgi:hypothetical protein